MPTIFPPLLQRGGVMRCILRDASGISCSEERPEGRRATVGELIRPIHLNSFRINSRCQSATWPLACGEQGSQAQWPGTGNTPAACFRSRRLALTRIRLVDNAPLEWLVPVDARSHRALAVRLLSLLDLTSLGERDTPAQIEVLCAAAPAPANS